MNEEANHGCMLILERMEIQKSYEEITGNGIQQRIPCKKLQNFRMQLGCGVSIQPKICFHDHKALVTRKHQNVSKSDFPKLKDLVKILGI